VGRWFGGTLVRCVFAQCIMSPVLVVIRDVFSQEPAKMVFIQRNDMIEDFPASTSDPAFRDSGELVSTRACLRFTSRGPF
jgi:hypothetical protein